MDDSSSFHLVSYVPFRPLLLRRREARTCRLGGLNRAKVGQRRVGCSAMGMKEGGLLDCDRRRPFFVSKVVVFDNRASSDVDTVVRTGNDGDESESGVGFLTMMLQYLEMPQSLSDAQELEICGLVSFSRCSS
ncbi:hypothetical protein OPV22_034127 [Ensete ventricosum]|uniref:Uncharacterized protein n=1 Tax=Ensete ventricosum TaxID=4639 RepID=A0AAV8P1H5_ENSVE|nr:hypothetical protein OPV22_034127 [Ensete ventricosum]